MGDAVTLEGTQDLESDIPASDPSSAIQFVSCVTFRKLLDLSGP